MPDRLFALVVVLLLPAAAVRGEDWPEFRGPTGQGTYPGRLPTEWSDTKNVAWKQAIPGKGWSSPILHDGRVYLTTAVPVENSPSNDQSLAALCLDARSGKIVWQTEVFRQDGAAAPRIHTKNSHASPTPLTDGRRLYVHFGHQGTAALDLAGKVLWRNSDFKYEPVHGNGGSPVLVDDLLVFAGDGRVNPFVVALEGATGKVRWKTDRKTDALKKFSFSTPLVIAVKGQKQLISAGSNAVCACDPRTGQELWRVRYEGYSVVPRPVFGNGLLFVCTGYDSPTVIAVRPDGQGDVTKTHVVWTLRKGAPHNPSPLLVGDELYVVSDLGIASCLDAATGRPHWQERLGGGYSASPLYADGKVYFQNEDGTGTVVKAGKQFEAVARNALGERTLASCAAADGALFIRTEGHLYRIEAR